MDEIQIKLWKNEQEILDVVHEVCVSNGLKYSLAYGTLLGAVRHGGFIPWDDDIDILMPREDYTKLLEIWSEKAPEDYILQEPYSSSDITNNFVKIRKNHTTFIQTEAEKKCEYHKGIFIDVFPLDRLAEGRLRRAKQKLFCLLAMLYNRGHTSGSGGIMEFCERFLLDIIPKSKYRCVEKWAEKKATRWNGNSSLEWFGFQTVSDMRHHYSPDIFENLIELEFEQKKYCVFRNYDQVLHDEFDDYMQLPPEEERVWKHHPIIIDFEQNYEELTDRQ